MSASLVRKALCLVNDDLSSEKKEKNKTAVPTTKWGVKKKSLHQKNFKKLTLKEAKIKCAIEEYKSKQPADHTKDNICLFKKLSERRIQPSTVSIVLDHHKRLLKDKKLVEQKKEESTLFTESDFKKWERQYVK